MDLTLLFVVVLAILGMINAVVQVVKTSFKLANKYVPIVSMAVGILIGIAVCQSRITHFTHTIQKF